MWPIPSSWLMNKSIHFDRRSETLTTLIFLLKLSKDSTVELMYRTRRFSKARHAASRRSSSSHTRRTTSPRHLPLGVMVQSIFAHFKFMTIGRLTLALPEPTRPWRHLLSEFYDYPSTEIHTRRFNPFFTSSIFRLFDSPRLTHIHPRPFRSGYHGESLGLDTHVSSFLKG